MEKKREIICDECGWGVPEELLDTYLKGNSIFCEKCGKEIFMENSQEKTQSPSKHSDSIKKAFSLVRKKSVVFKDKVKQRIKELREKYD